MALSDSFADLWKQARENYLKSASNKERRLLERIEGLQNTSELEALLEAENKQFETYREKHGKIWKYLKKAADVFVGLSSTISSAVALTPFAPASTLVGAAVFLVNSATGVSQIYDWIEGLFAELSHFVDRLDEYMVGDLPTRLQRRIGEILSCFLEILVQSRKAIKDSRWKEFTANVFLGKDRDVKESFNKLTKLFDYEQKLVTAMTFAKAQKIEKGLAEVNASAKRIDITVQKAATDRGHQLQSSSLETQLLTQAHLESRKLYFKYEEETLASTGAWLLREREFKRWKDGRGRFLWVKGGPGTGKSFLSSVTISHLKSIYTQALDDPCSVSLAYFYIKKYDERLQDLDNILRSLVYQITQVDSLFRSHAVNILRKPDAVATARKFWKNLILGFYRDRTDLPNSAMIILDGLDEAPRETVKDIFSLLELAGDVKGTNTRLSFAIFTRPDIMEHIGSNIQAAMSKIEIGENNIGDIAVYVKTRVKALPIIKAMRSLTSKISQRHAALLECQIIYKIMAQADGMFFKVALILDQLPSKGRKQDIYDTIDSAPRELERMIAHVFEKIVTSKSVDLADLKDILLWVSFARRPLTLAELFQILRYRTGQYDLLLESRLRGALGSVFQLVGLPESDESGDHAVTNTFFPRTWIFEGKSEEETDEDGDEEEDPYAFEKAATEIEDQLRMQGPFDANYETLTLGEADIFDDESVWQRFGAIQLRFTHASIYEFLLNPKDAEVAKHLKALGLALDSAGAAHQVASTCIRAILDGSDLERQWFTNHYAAHSLVEHINSVVRTGLSREEKKSFTQLLCRLFFHGPSHTKLLMAARSQRTLEYLFEHKSFARNVQDEWLAKAEQEWFSPEEWHWIQQASRSRQEFFRPLAGTAGRELLTTYGATGDSLPKLKDTTMLYHVWILFYFLRTDTHTTNLEGVRGRLMLEKSPSSDLKVLEQIVNFNQVDRTSFWHAWYGWLLDMSNHTDLAIIQFDEALKLEPKPWKILQLKANCLVQLGRHDLARAVLEDAIQNLPDSDKLTRSEIDNELIDMLLSQEEFDQALERARLPYAKHRDSLFVCGPDYDQVDPVMPITYNFIRCLFAVRDFEAIVGMVDELAKFKQWQSPSALVTFLTEVGFEVGCALQSQDAISLIRELLYEAVQVYNTQGVFSRDPWALITLARFIYHFQVYDDIHGAQDQDLFEKAVKLEVSLAVTEELDCWYYKVVKSASRYLASIYYERAVESAKDGYRSDFWLEKLLDCAVTDQIRERRERHLRSFRSSWILLPTNWSRFNNPDTQSYSLNRFSQCLGVYYRKHLHAQIAKFSWENCFRGPINQALDILTNGGPTSRIGALIELLSCLICAGDLKNASAAAAVLFAQPSRLPNNEFPSKHAESVESCASVVFCDGLCLNVDNRCNVYKRKHKELHFCTECPGIVFCESCFPLLKERKLPFRKCNAEHEFVQFWPVPEEAKGIAGNMSEDSIEIREDWVEALRAKWPRGSAYKAVGTPTRKKYGSYYISVDEV